MASGQFLWETVIEEMEKEFPEQPRYNPKWETMDRRERDAWDRIASRMQAQVYNCKMTVERTFVIKAGAQ
jgi:hypothetical protein